MTKLAIYTAIDQWVDAHFNEQVQFLQALVQVPTDTPPGNNAPHAEVTAALLEKFGFEAQKYPVPLEQVKAYGMESITNLIVRRPIGSASGSSRPLTIALNAHGDVVPPGEGWTYPPYSAQIVDGKLYGRAAAVSKSDIASYTFAIRALESVIPSSADAATANPKAYIELLVTYDEEFGGELGPALLLEQGLTNPDYLLAAGFSYQVITAHNGCLQMEVTVHGVMAHAAIPQSGIDALQGATHILNALYAQNIGYKNISSKVPGITHPYLNIGRIEGGTNTNVVPGKVVMKLDRRMIPEEDPATVEAQIREVIAKATIEAQVSQPGLKVEIKRLLRADAWKPQDNNQKLVDPLQRHATEIFGEPITTTGTPLYTDVRLFGARAIPAAIYGAGPRTVRESNAKRADEHLVLEDLRKATKVIARTLFDLLD
jgi:succinyl-diaminopimelate desuccinylase